MMPFLYENAIILPKTSTGQTYRKHSKNGVSLRDRAMVVTTQVCCEREEEETFLLFLRDISFHVLKISRMIYQDRVGTHAREQEHSKAFFLFFCVCTGVSQESVDDQVRKRVLFAMPFMYQKNTIILPRQARDKDRESTRKETRVLCGRSARCACDGLWRAESCAAFQEDALSGTGAQAEGGGRSG